MLPLFFIKNISDQVITLDEETSRHVVQVLRMKNGERLQLTDGNGAGAEVVITDEHKKKCTVEVVSRETKPKPGKNITIAISLLKNAVRFEWFLEKATEIGIAEVVPLLCSRTEKQHFRYDRMNGIVISAMLQSQRYYKPVLHEPVRFTDLLKDADQEVKLIAHCMDDQPRINLSDIQVDDSAIILIGPEGDFTEEEIKLAEGFTRVSLGNNRLRTETAGIVAATLLCR